MNNWCLDNSINNLTRNTHDPTNIINNEQTIHLRQLEITKLDEKICSTNNQNPSTDKQTAFAAQRYGTKKTFLNLPKLEHFYFIENNNNHNTASNPTPSISNGIFPLNIKNIFIHKLL
jgi:hypothetical protein